MHIYFPNFFSEGILLAIPLLDLRDKTFLDGAGGKVISTFRGA